MTDITELAQSLKAAAKKATPGEWVVQLGDEVYATDDGVDFEHVAIATNDARDADYIALANPANILALVESLEKAHTENTAGAAGMAESYETTISMLKSRIAELEFIRTSADKVQREFADDLGCAGDNESILQAIEDLKVQSETALELKQAALAENFHLKLELEIAEKRIAEPEAQNDYFASLVAMARASADKAMRKFPQPNYVLLKVAEEAGEVVQAGVHYAENRMEWGQVEGEIVQLLAMIIRLVTEGDQVNGITPPALCSACIKVEAE